MNRPQKAAETQIQTQKCIYLIYRQYLGDHWYCRCVHIVFFYAFLNYQQHTLGEAHTHKKYQCISYVYH